MRYIGVLFIGLLFTIASSYAAEQIMPADIENWQQRTPEELEGLQRWVNDGHQPWRADPEYYARLFINFYYPDLDPNDRERLPGKSTVTNDQAVVEVTYNNRVHTVYMHKIFPNNTESLWLVDRMVII